MKTILSFLALTLSASAALAQPVSIWFEGENPKATDFPQRHSFAPGNAKEADVLSEGAWIGADGKRENNLFLEYEVSVPQAGDYQLFARKFWKHGPFRWRFDKGPWTEITRDVALLDEAPIRQFLVANWIGAGSAKLDAGKHTLRIELLEKEGAAAFDAFLLTTNAFTPRGKMKPGEKFNRAPQGWFAFEPDDDTFQPTLLDLRKLNEKYAGENGFIQVRGREFIHGNNGQRLRFWGMNTGHEALGWPRPAIDLFARTLAKQGVNLIRIHGAPWESGDIRRVDAKELDKLFYFISAMKSEGIYSCLSIYFPLWIDLEKSPIPGYKAGQRPFSLLFFNPEFQEIYRGWWRAILTTPNPYSETKAPLSDEPAIAMCELVNEESHFFWTFKPYDSIPETQTIILEKQFGDWLKQKYGAPEAALAAWGGAKVRGDEPAQGRIGFTSLWDIFNKKDKRAQDTAAFLAFNQKDFYDRHLQFLKNDLGYKGTVYGSNWTTANPQILGPIDKWTNIGADFLDRHGYFGGTHEGPRAGYSLSAGDKYDDRSALFFKNNKGEDDFGLPLMDLQYNGKPSMISEVNWTPPNRYRAEFPFLFATYGSLQGSDAIIYFAARTPAWENQLGKFSVRTPTITGQFPALAWMFRRGLVQVGPTVVEAHLPVDDLLALKGAPVSAPQNLDELRATDIPAGQSAPVEKVKAIDPLAFLTGRVEMHFDKGQDRIADLSKYINRTNKTVRSATGELTWDYGNGAVTLRAQQAQAVSGFLSKQGIIDLGAITVQSPLEYGAITLVALDDKPLATSGQMLLQVISEDNNYGWETNTATGIREIKSLGAMPLVVKNIEGTVSFKRADDANLKITPLDFNGYPIEPAKALGGTQLTLRPNVLYYLITRG